MCGSSGWRAEDLYDTMLQDAMSKREEDRTENDVMIIESHDKMLKEMMSEVDSTWMCVFRLLFTLWGIAFLSAIIMYLFRTNTPSVQLVGCSECPYPNCRHCDTLILDEQARFLPS